MIKTSITSIYFGKLKGLQDVTIEIKKPLTAIMGVNGSGKTTVIHALACAFRPDGEGENHKFPEFFVPNTDALWNGSIFRITNMIEGQCVTRTYSKIVGRWTPRYNDRPKRNVYYLGIDTCMPEIEKNTHNSMIKYTSNNREGRKDKKILEIAARILNKDYQILVDNEYHTRHFMGVCTRSGLQYSSLSMGTGEQRTIKIIEKVLSAEPYSLILIDEIDLLLHVSALNQLVQELYRIAIAKHLQIIFTTHSLEILKLGQYVGIQYIDTLKKHDGTVFFQIYNKPSSDIIRRMTGAAEKPVQIWVEDNFSRAIVKTVIRRVSKMSSKTEVKTFGAATNAFTLVAGQVISEASLENMLVLLDGDVYKNDEEKMAQLKKAYSGTESDSEERRNTALKCISQYALPEDTPPEKFMFDLLCASEDNDNEIVQAALRINSVEDSHQYITLLCEEFQESMDTMVERIVQIIGQKEEWANYIQPVELWLKERADV